MAIGVDKLLLPWANYNRLWAWLNIADCLWPMIVYSRQSGKIWQPPSAKLHWSCCRCCKALHADIDGFPFLRSPARRFHSASGVGATKYNRFRNPIPDRSPLSAQLFQMNNLSGAAQKKRAPKAVTCCRAKKKKKTAEKAGRKKELRQNPNSPAPESSQSDDPSRVSLWIISCSQLTLARATPGSLLLLSTARCVLIQ